MVLEWVIFTNFGGFKKSTIAEIDEGEGIVADC